MPRIVAIGETGLDYYRLSGDLSWQRERFRIAHWRGESLPKALIIHTRAAAADTITIMTERRCWVCWRCDALFYRIVGCRESRAGSGLLHFFLGHHQFKNASDLREVVRQVPLDRLLIETDSPYLAPMPHRGKMNQPAYVKHVAECVSTIKNIPLEIIADVTSKNFFTLFQVTQISILTYQCHVPL